MWKACGESMFRLSRRILVNIYPEPLWILLSLVEISANVIWWRNYGWEQFGWYVGKIWFRKILWLGIVWLRCMLNAVKFFVKMYGKCSLCLQCVENVIWSSRTREIMWLHGIHFKNSIEKSWIISKLLTNSVTVAHWKLVVEYRSCR